ncbi:MAG: hypothetical protein AB1404_12845 [Spirochaetota bacterium]
MKKAKLTLLSAVIAAGLVALMGCPQPTTSGGGGGGGGTTTSQLYVYPYTVDTDFTYDIWESTFTAEELGTDGQKINVNSTWAGGSFARVLAPRTTFNFTNVKKLVFEIRSTNMNPAWFKVLLQNGSTDIISQNLKNDLNISSLSGTEWTKVEVDVSSLYNKKVTSAFSFVVANDPDGVPEGTSFDIRKIDWVDETGASVNICEGEPNIPVVTYPDVYYLYKSDNTKEEGVNIVNWSSGSTLTTIANYESMGWVYKVEPGMGWGASSSCIAFTGLMDYQNVYTKIVFKIKSDTTEPLKDNNINVKIPEVEQPFNITQGVDLNNGWYEVTVPFSSFTGTKTDPGEIGILGGWSNGGIFYITDIRFEK